MTHLRGHFLSFILPISFLTLAVAALVMRLAASGDTKLSFRSQRAPV
jgi:hypothetical protein